MNALHFTRNEDISHKHG